MSRKEKSIDLGGPCGLTHNPFASLRAAGESSPDPDTRSSAPDVSEDGTTDGDEAPLMGSRVVVRRERKRRGGKTVTIATWQEPSAPPAEALAELAKQLARALGAGVRVDGADIVIQGDMVERVAARLETDLEARVVRGSS